MNDNEKMNRLIAEFMAVPCLHGDMGHESGEWDSKCEIYLCGICKNPFNDEVPLYTSPNSPRRLLDEAEAKCIEKVGRAIYGKYIARNLPPTPELNIKSGTKKEAFDALRPAMDVVVSVGATADALTRCRAIIAACGLEQQEKQVA